MTFQSSAITSPNRSEIGACVTVRLMAFGQVKWGSSRGDVEDILWEVCETKNRGAESGIRADKCVGNVPDKRLGGGGAGVL